MESSCLINDPFWFILIRGMAENTGWRSLINTCARLFIETDNQSCETFDQIVSEKWKGKQGKCRPMQSTQPIWLSDVASRKLTGRGGERERERGASLGIGWPLGSLVVSGITLFPRTSSSSSRVRHWPTLAAREARIGKGYITFCSTCNEARA